MAESYQAARANSPEILNGLDIYFFVADFSQNQMSFQQVIFYLFAAILGRCVRAGYCLLLVVLPSLLLLLLPPFCCFFCR